MQDPKIPKARKPWYQRAKEMATIWKAFGTKPSPGSPSSSSTTTTSLWKSFSRTREISSSSTNYCTTTTTNTTTTQNKQQKLRKSTSLKVASSFTRVCLCAPISYYNEVFQADHHVFPPRRSNSYPRSSNKPLMTSNNNNNSNQQERTLSGRMSVEGRKIFRGKSLTDDVQMRRFVVEEEAMMQQLKRRNEMEVIRRRSGMRRKKLGPSLLSRMVLAEEEE